MKKLRLARPVIFAIMITLTYSCQSAWADSSGDNPEQPVFFAPEAADASVPVPAPPPKDSGLLWLVNPENRLESNFVPSSLVKSGDYRMRRETRAAWENMLAALNADGITDLRIQSAYRTYSQQEQIFANKKAQYTGEGHSEAEAEKLTARSIAFPGASEHQTGLALDVTVNGRLNGAFADTEAGRWIAEHCHEYGFVVRYAEEKTHITGIIFEPWHLRYVGRPHSSFMVENNLCLEEYAEYLDNNRLYVFWENVRYHRVELTQDASALPLENAEDVSALRPGSEWRVVTVIRKRPAAALPALSVFPPHTGNNPFLSSR
ncbi:MAG: D-alanyl-D-alanine carboxypeptidase family protein [Clostridiales bacterium]|jgi:LAS superfamily LD-carboxypeptidase LdcB|nr:D-alanyl-D-alanine carboxypeptidase family protein [Clostridiales bacterium]